MENHKACAYIDFLMFCVHTTLPQIGTVYFRKISYSNYGALKH